MSNPFSSNQLTFASQFIAQSGLNGGVVMAWMVAEEPVGASATVGNNNQDWLNIGGPGARAGAGNPQWQNPTTAGEFTWKWIKGQWDDPGFGTAASSIQSAIPGAVGKSPQAQMQAIDSSGWLPGGYGNLQTLYSQYGQFAPAPGKPVSGGVAGMGGTGSGNSSTSTSPQPFTVEANEDYWTAANRLAQQAQVYLFSDAEVVYLMDGSSLLNQNWTAILDRWIDPNTGQIRTRTTFPNGLLGADVIQRLAVTWDNTAFEWSSTHKRRGKVQRKSILSKIQSPTEVQAEIICPIDYFRAGDMVILVGCGPANGSWIVGTCVRSVFQVYSTLTLVPGMAPLPEFEVAGVGSTSSKAPGAPGGGPSGGSPTGNYKNLSSPFTKAYLATQGNVDMGVDFGTQQGIAAGDPILAIGDCYCTSITPFYAGQPAMWFKFASGVGAPYHGWYVSEQITTKVAASSTTLIKKGTTVATFASSGTGIEIGWSSADGQTATQGLHPNEVATRHNGSGTTDGNNFWAFLKQVNAVHS